MYENLTAALRKVVEAGYQLSADGFEYLKNLDEGTRDKLMEHAIHRANSSREAHYILDGVFLQTIMEELKVEAELRKTPTGKRADHPLASEYDAQLEVLEDYKAEPDGNVEGFVDYFRSRYCILEGIIRKRMDVRDAVTIGQALSLPIRSKCKVIGMVTQKNARGNRLFIELEDLEDSITVMASDEEPTRKGLMILEDQVICVDAIKYRDELLIATDFIWPDIPMKAPGRSKEPLCAAFLADIHVGSTHFMEDLFNRFIRWMNSEIGPPESRKIATRVKYVIVAGDLVDGIGVYPDQINELTITDVRKQYEAASYMLSMLPDYVSIIVIPGNHDAVRKSLPQPPISKKYANSLHMDARIKMLGNPARILINGVEALLCHGKALDDVLSQTPGLNFMSPIDGMELLLKSRHVAPTYGASTPIAPERKDRLVIASVPDVFHMGHIHIYGSRRYKGVTTIASGSWQSQTSFQRRMNLIPTTGIAPILDLQTHRVAALDLNRLVS